MKRLNRKGFTLIELLAVITIMGILMIVAIPAISRTIENSRRDTFADTAKQYVNSVKTMWASDSLECQTIPDDDDSFVIASALTSGNYYVLIDTTKTGETIYPTLLESGGKSSWGSKDVKGFVLVSPRGEGSSRTVTYKIRLSDGTHGILNNTSVDDIKRSSVAVSGVSYDTMSSGAYYCREV